jgi:hypothetical protein
LVEEDDGKSEILVIVQYTEIEGRKSGSMVDGIDDHLHSGSQLCFSCLPPPPLIFGLRDNATWYLQRAFNMFV